MKRFMDITGAILGLLLCGPLLFIVMLWIRCTLGRPVFFVQWRPGLGGRPFRLIKFRTMAERYNEDGSPLADELRMTRLGRFLRRASLDEMPELLNVLKGEMSLVGPRPLLMEYLPLYSPEQSRRHGVRPGLTGWAQVNGRNDTTWEARLARDVWYVDHQSIWLDVRILCMTVGQVLLQRGVNAPGHVTMPQFRGDRPADSR